MQAIQYIDVLLCLRPPSANFRLGTHISNVNAVPTYDVKHILVALLKQKLNPSATGYSGITYPQKSPVTR